MNQLLEQWTTFIEGNAPSGFLSPTILESWQRSRAAGVDPVAPRPHLHRVTDEELECRRWANAGLLSLAQPRLEVASSCLAAVPHVLCLTDRQGIVLFAVGNHPRMEEVGLFPGLEWSEQRMGTNGIGTVLETHKPMSVVGAEHFEKFLHDFGSEGAPLCDPEGAVLGAVSITTSLADNIPNRLEMVTYIAKIVEQDLADPHRHEGLHNNEEFLVQLVHDLRNPFTSLRNSLHLIRLSENDFATMNEARELAERQVGQLAALADDLLDISRLSGSRIHLQKQLVAVKTLVDEAIAITRPLLEGRTLQVTVLLPPEPLFLVGDPARLVQILTHLLANAAKYTESGGHVWISAERDGNEILLSVRDTGIGLPEEMLPDAFDLFFRKGVGVWGGLRIGLHLARALIELHGGKIIALSDGEDKGSEFVVRLPASAREEPAEKANPVPGQVAATDRSLRVLIVEDNFDVASSLARLVKVWHHDIQITHDGFAALEVARTWKPQVILLDLGLPGGLDGFQVAAKLRAELGLDRAIIASMTGFGWKDDVGDAAQVSFDYHLTKPVNLQALEQLLARVELSRAKSGSD